MTSISPSRDTKNARNDSAIACYSFEDGADDECGSNDGVVTGAEHTQGGKHGWGYLSTGDNIHTTSLPHSFTNNTEGAYDLWIKTSQIPPANYRVYNDLLSRHRKRFN